MDVRKELVVTVAAFAAIGAMLGISQIRKYSGPPRTDITTSAPVCAFEMLGKKWVAAALTNGSLELYDGVSGRRLWRKENTNFQGLKFTRDGARLIAWDGTSVVFFDPATGTERGRVQSAEPTIWSASDRYFVAKSKSKTKFIVGDAMTGETRLYWEKLKDSLTALTNSGDLYFITCGNLNWYHGIFSGKFLVFSWIPFFTSIDHKWNVKDVYISSLDHRMGMGKINGTFSKVTQLQISPDDKTMAIGSSDGALEMVDIGAIRRNTDLLGYCFSSRKQEHVASRKIMLRKLSGWMAWLQEGPLVVDTRPAGDPLADYTLYDAKGQVQGAFQTVDSDSWISAQGTLVLELRDGQAVAQKSTKLSSQESVLDLTPGDNTLIRVYGENIAAVARDRTIARYDLTD